MKNKFMIATLLVSSVLFCRCAEDEDPLITIEGNDLEVTIPENPEVGLLLGKIVVSITNENSSTIGLDEGDLSNFISFDENTGEVRVTDPTIFDFEQRDRYSAQVRVSASNKNHEIDKLIGINITLTNVIEKAEMSAQERLDAGETPLEIYNSDNSLLNNLYGATYAGGLIFYFNTTDGKGFVAAPSDQSISIAWDPETNFVNQVATGAVGATLGDGAANTATIVNVLTTGSYAAHICNDLVIGSYDDWFLPTVAGLDLMYEKLHTAGIGDFQATKYWSSEEFNLSTAAALWSSFDRSGGQSGGSTPKNALYGVRAIREF